MSTPITSFARSYLRTHAARFMENRGRLFTPGKTKVVYDPTTRSAVVQPSRADKYEGPLRYWEVSAGSKATVGEREYTVSQSWVSLPYDAKDSEGRVVMPESDDIIQILASGGRGDDPALVGRYLRVISVVRGGGLRSSRKMLVEFTDYEEKGH